MNLNNLLELDELAREDGKKYLKKRELYSQLVLEKGKHFTGIVGPRGVGKTVLLKQLAIETDNSFYISTDTLEEDNLFEIAKSLIERYRIKLLLVDEIHFQKKYEQELKKIYDFLNIRVIFTSSVSLSIFESSYDLSRRLKLITLYPFSFREFIFFKKDVSIPTITLNDILEKQWTDAHLRYEYLFDDYVQGGLMPFTLEEPDALPIIRNILHKIINKDIPLVAKLRIDEISTIEKVLKFIGRSEVDGINYSSISGNIGITKYKAEQYIRLLEKAFVLNPIFPQGTNVLKEPKILMYLPFRLLYKDYGECIGALREDFFCQMLKTIKDSFYYLKTKRGAKTADFLVKQDDGAMVIEIGGKGKGREQFKGISVKKKMILCHPSIIKELKRPLCLAGFLY